MNEENWLFRSMPADLLPLQYQADEYGTYGTRRVKCYGSVYQTCVETQHREHGAQQEHRRSCNYLFHMALYLKVSAHGRTRTADQRFRKPTLCPAELHGLPITYITTKQRIYSRFIISLKSFDISK